MEKIKVNISLISGLIFYSCMNPSEPVASRLQLITTIKTGGKCRDIDFNDSLMIAAADTNGFQGYTYSFSNEGIFDYAYEFSNSGSDLNESFTANKIIISKNRKFFLLMDKNDGLYASSNLSNNILFEHIYSTSSNRDYIQSVTLKENENEIHMATLIKQDASCSVYSYRFPKDNWGGGFVEDDNGIIWITPESDSIDGFSIEASDLFFVDSLLIVADLTRVKIIKENSDSTFSNYFSFDTPGTAETLYADSNMIFTGLGDDKGCLISPMDTTVLLMNQITVADGYSVKGIHKQNELLALACGYGGVLLYTCYSNDNLPVVSEIGKINSRYTYNVKIYDSNTIFVATIAGIQIYSIER
jgi:hypothetical protein